MIAGGGFKGGQVLGASDKRGEEVTDHPVHPSHLIGKIYEQLGIAPDAKLPHPEGRDIRVMPGDEAKGQLENLLAGIT